MGYDRRIGFEFLKPGPGFGGSCFPKDTRALVRIAEDAGYDFGLLKGVIEVNDEQFDRVVAKVERMCGGSVDGELIAAWGLTFKARTDDLRGSPAVEVLNRLQQRGARIRAYDPAITDSVHGVEAGADPYAVCEGAAVLLVLTEWDEFRWLDFEKVGGLMAHRRLVDARNLLDPAAVRRRGFAYDAVGRN
jgi:UDPglucose 6-dehydrogenase